MAGMFYPLQQVAEKLNKTEEEVKEMVRSGKLREFRDGPNLLFKIDEVEALASKTKPAKGAAPQADDSEILLSSETTEAPAVESDLTEADTIATGDGTSALEETESDYSLAKDTEDTKSKTRTGSGEASLEEIEGDVNLDSFGTGSGLLDLSLQADDTSLGGILDEIYAPTSEEGKEAAVTSPDLEVTAAAEQIPPDEGYAPHPAPAIQAMAQAYIEPQPDTISNALGIMLILPLLAVVYTAIIIAASLHNTMPSILEGIHGIIWYILIGVAVAAGLIVGIAFMLGSSGKTEKKPKVKKEKKPKAAKKSSAAGSESKPPVPGKLMLL